MITFSPLQYVRNTASKNPADVVGDVAHVAHPRARDLSVTLMRLTGMLNRREMSAEGDNEPGPLDLRFGRRILQSNGHVRLPRLFGAALSCILTGQAHRDPCFD